MSTQGETNQNRDAIKKKNRKIDSWRTRLTIFGIVLIVWAGFWFAIHLLFDDYETRGQFGDMFGSVNALFSALAFAGIIYTILLQRQELIAQRTQIRLNRDEMKLARLEYEQQNSTLKKQRFENTFFKLLDTHNILVNSFSVQKDTGRDTNEVGRMLLTKFHDALRDELLAEPKSKTSGHYIQYVVTLNKFPELKLYFDSVRTILQYLQTTDLIDNIEKQLYVEIFKSQLMHLENTILIYHIYFLYYPEKKDRLSNLLLDLKIVNFASFITFHDSHDERIGEISLEHFKSKGV